MISRLLGPAEIRRLAGELGVRPTKQLGQNFLHDANTIRRIVAIAGVREGDHVVEIGPGLGSLTLGLLDAGATVQAIEIDPVLAGALPGTVERHQPDNAADLTVITNDAMNVTAMNVTGMNVTGMNVTGMNVTAMNVTAMNVTAMNVTAMNVNSLTGEPQLLVANLPYNVSVPVLLHFLASFPSITRGLVMVQAEVAQRLCAPPGSRVYGVPSAKAAWDADLTLAGPVPRGVFWPVPNVDSLLVSFRRREPAREGSRAETFGVIDAAFAQRRKTLRSCLAGWAGSPAEAERLLRAAGIDPGLRGEALAIEDFARLAATRTQDRG